MSAKPVHAAQDDAARDLADDRPLRGSLVAVWLLTAVVSVVELHGQSTALLVDAGWRNARWMQAVILCGALADALLGLAMWRWPGRRVYAAALGMMAVMTVAATVLQPALWLHPLGPLTKNLPIAAVLVVLMRRDCPPKSTSSRRTPSP